MIPSSLTLHQGPPKEWVLPWFYGGPLDGHNGPAMQCDDLTGSMDWKGGEYQLQGFVNVGSNLDYAIYDWSPKT